MRVDHTAWTQFVHVTLAGDALRLVLGPADLVPPAVTVLHQWGPADVDSHVDRVLAVLDETFLDVVLLTLLLLQREIFKISRAPNIT